MGKAGAAKRPDRIILGSGEHKYECVHDWLTPPADILWGDTQGVAQSTNGTHSTPGQTTQETPDAAH